jgi:hypothetical protein
MGLQQLLQSPAQAACNLHAALALALAQGAQRRQGFQVLLLGQASWVAP